MQYEQRNNNCSFTSCTIWWFNLHTYNNYDGTSTRMILPPRITTTNGSPWLKTRIKKNNTKIHLSHGHARTRTPANLVAQKSLHGTITAVYNFLTTAKWAVFLPCRIFDESLFLSSPSMMPGTWFVIIKLSVKIEQ